MNYTQKPILDPIECDELISLYHKRHDDTFRLDWKVERNNLYTDRKQRLYLFGQYDILHRTLTEKILSHHSQVCNELEIEQIALPYVKEIFIAEYNVGEGVDWHTDFEYHEKQPPFVNKRRYNFSILLNSSYECGILEVNKESVNTPIGVATFFDVNTDHRVTRVTDGTRYSLIGWVYM